MDKVTKKATRDYVKKQLSTLDTYGRYYPVKGFAKHDEWAAEWLKNKGVGKYEGYAYEELQRRGWMRIMDWGAGTKMNFVWEKTPNHSQKETLYLFCSLHNTEFPEELKDF